MVVVRWLALLSRDHMVMGSNPAFNNLFQGNYFSKKLCQCTQKRSVVLLKISSSPSGQDKMNKKHIKFLCLDHADRSFGVKSNRTTFVQLINQIMSGPSMVSLYS